MKAIAGEDGVAVCRSLLDGIEDDWEGELQSRVTEGRCTGNYEIIKLNNRVVSTDVVFHHIIMRHMLYV